MSSVCPGSWAIAGVGSASDGCESIPSGSARKLDGTNRHAAGVERVIFAEAAATGAGVLPGEGTGSGAAGNSGTIAVATVGSPGGVCAARDARSESGDALAPVVAPGCAVDAKFPCGIPSQRNAAGSREAKDREPPAAGDFAGTGSAAAAFPEGSADAGTAETESVADGDWLAGPQEPDELSGPLTNAGAPVVRTVPGSGVRRVVCAQEGGALACGRGAFAGTKAVSAVRPPLDSEPCVVSGRAAGSVTLEAGICVAVLWPPVGRTVETKACAVSLSLGGFVKLRTETCGAGLLIVAALESNVGPAVLLSARVTMLGPEVGATPLVPAAVVCPKRCESDGCVAVPVALGAAKSAPETAEAGASPGASAVPGESGAAIARERGAVGSEATGAGKIAGITAAGNSAESEAVGLVLAAGSAGAVPPLDFLAWAAAGALLASEACSTSEKLATALSEEPAAAGCAAVFPRSDVPVSTLAAGIVCDTSTMDSICPADRKASRGPKKNRGVRLCVSRKCHKKGGLKKGLKFLRKRAIQSWVTVARRLGNSALATGQRKELAAISLQP